MSAINKELYDALMKAGAPDDLATAAARSVSEDQGPIKEDLVNIRTRLVMLETRLAMVEKLQWVIVIGVIGLVLKALFV